MKLKLMRRAAPLVWAGTFVGGSAMGQDALQTLEALTVLGDREEIFTQVGSSAFIGQEEIRAANSGNINEVLARVPGVYVREEDGFGNFPNVSIRGADGTRSEKVTVMEDGILVAPAPYAGPAAYVTPRVARMSGVEVLKGSSQVRFGPQTTGGVINYLSTPVPQERTFYARTTYGSHDTFFGHIYGGETIETDAGRFGYLLELHGNFSEGFRNIDGSSRSTGFSLIEPMLKLCFEPDTLLKQRFELKAGYTSFDTDETYTGLAVQDLRQRPDRRYAATLYDNLEAEQYRTYLKWIAEPSESLRFESAAYYGYVTRNWYKLDRVNGSRIHEILASGNPLPGDFDTLRGTAPGVTDVKANNRIYSSYGWQNQANIRFETGELSHDVAVGLRLHYDYQERAHWLDKYNADGSGNFTFGSRTRDGQDNRLEEIFATAIYVEDEIRTGALTLRPGIRYEWLELDERVTDNASGTTTRQSGDENLFTAGVGANYEIDDAHSVYGGIYRGVSSPGVSDYLAGVDEEESIGYELGIRHRRDALNLEFTGFFTDFQNLISTDTGLAGALTSNAGEAEVFGLETIAQYDAAMAAGMDFSVPLYLSATWTSAEFKNTTAALAGGGDGIYAGGRAGNEIPYVPEWKLAGGVGFHEEYWGVNLDATYTSSTWGTGYNDDPRPGTQTSRDGKIDPLLIFNLSGYYEVRENVRLLAGVHNLFDERGVVSRIPEGPRSNAPRSIFAGVEASF